MLLQHPSHTPQDLTDGLVSCDWFGVDAYEPQPTKQSTPPTGVPSSRPSLIQLCPSLTNTLFLCGCVSNDIFFVMSTAASSASSTLVRSQSSRNPPPFPSPSSNTPTRTRSSAAPSTTSHYRSGSRYNRDGPPPSNPTALANVARRDFETSNVARPGSSRQSSSKDEAYDGRPPTSRTDSTRSHHRTSSRNGHSRTNSDMSGAATVVSNGGSTPVAPPPAAAQSDRPVPTTHPSGRRRTTITATTGQWSLGKTIGAGSMGKVKLAKNLETGEQVCASRCVTRNA